ncbi:hypothetical protein [Nocardioides ferulae]|uniref:hypothetical protein n=1 Tax=Nocardioides ferulae TaxID=2340821 RepID=UPI000F890DC0|nr:hypothetical protein [Nocardioides ferulae]
MTTRTMRLEPMPPKVRAWGLAEGVAAWLLLGWTGSITVFVLAFVAADHDVPSLAEEGYPALMAGGAAAGLATSAVCSWLGGRLVVWWAPATLLGITVGATTVTDGPGNALLAAGVGISAVCRARSTRGRQLLLPERGRRTAMAVVSGVTLTAGTLFGVNVVVGGGPTDTYQLLQDDPMATEDLPGLEVVWDRSADEDWKGTSARVDRVWRITDGSSRREKLAGLATLAESHGWQAQPKETFCEHTRTSAGVTLCLEIRAGFAPGEVLVSLRPRHQPAYED